MKKEKRNNDLRSFLQEIKTIKDHHKSKKEKNRFNIFYALHKEHDEVNLHSRFISYLIADNSGHNLGNFFAKKFFEIVLKKPENLNFLENYEVLPNEFNKSEFKEIDLLLINKNQLHAIIIENKIFAADSNHEGKKKGYNGQLERYYNTILKGVPLVNRDDSLEEELILHEYISEKIDVYYLTLNKPKKESFEKSIGNIPKKVGVKTLFYNKEITKWLKICLNSEEVKRNFFLEKVITQYLILVENMANSNEERIVLKKLIGENLESTKHLFDNFIHVKWHSIHEFWIDLKIKLQEKDIINEVNLFPEDFEKAVSEISHNNTDLNHGVTFNIGNQKVYISGLNNLSWGILNSDKEWYQFKNKALKEVCFSDFSNENTFQIISKTKKNDVIKLIIDEILKAF